jgi:hypothetical protein
MIRFEILLPLFYNDGRPIEPEKFRATDDDLVDIFGATSTEQITVRGQWKYQTTVYADQLMRVRVDVEDTAPNWESMRQMKEKLKTRFEQTDIWITAHRIEIV